MTFPNPDYSKRDYLLPAGCKDLYDLIKREKPPGSAPPPYPPITRKIRLPEKVAVRFIAEIVTQDVNTTSVFMSKLQELGVDVNRSLDFDEAQLLLRHYGIWAEREGTSA